MSLHVKLFRCKPNTCRCNLCNSKCTGRNPVFCVHNVLSYETYLCRNCLIQLDRFCGGLFVDYLDDNDICEFCSKIFTPKEAKNWSDSHSEYRYTPTEYNMISKSSSGEFELWNRCDDDYYSGSIMKISYCPKCGRKL